MCVEVEKKVRDKEKEDYLPIGQEDDRLNQTRPLREQPKGCR